MQSKIPFLLPLVAVALSAQPQISVSRQSQHFSEPVIIENPDAVIRLLPANHASSLTERTGSQGQGWRVRQHDDLKKIRMTIGNNTVDRPSLLYQSPVVVEFDYRESANARPKVGTMSIEWTSSTDLVFESVSENPSGNRRLHWRRSLDSRDLLPRQNESYRIRLVRFRNAQGVQQCLPASCSPIQGDPTVKVYLCTQGNSQECN